MNAGQLFEAQVNNVLYVFWQRATEDELSIYIRKKKKNKTLRSWISVIKIFLKVVR